MININSNSQLNYYNIYNPGAVYAYRECKLCMHHTALVRKVITTVDLRKIKYQILHDGKT